MRVEISKHKIKILTDNDAVVEFGDLVKIDFEANRRLAYSLININEGDYVKTNKFSTLDSNTIYKVSHMIDTGLNKYILLYGCGNVKYNAELFERVEVK